MNTKTSVIVIVFIIVGFAGLAGGWLVALDTIDQLYACEAALP